MGEGSMIIASPHHNHQQLSGGPSNTTFRDDMANDMWALGVTFHDMVSCHLKTGLSAFAPSFSALQAVQAERPHDSLEKQCRVAMYNEQVQWVSAHNAELVITNFTA